MLPCVPPPPPQAVTVVEADRLAEGAAGLSGIVTAGDRFGASVALLGDLNGDGIDDYAVGAPGRDAGGRDRGAVWILFPDAAGNVLQATELSDSSGGLVAPLTQGDRFGWSLAPLGDLDGDGVPDLAVGYPERSLVPSAWPSGSGTDLSALLPGSFEPSGVTWHPGLELLVVVDDGGRVAALTLQGTLVGSWNLGVDFEAVCVSDPNGTTVLLGIEDPDRIVEFDIAAGVGTGNSWDVSGFLSGSATQGLEALTRVDGLVVAGHQETGNLYFFDLQPGSLAVLDRVLLAPGGRDDLSGLDYVPETGLLYGVYDPDNLLIEFLPDGTLLRAWPLGAGDQEGIALVDACPAPSASLVLADDAGPLTRFDSHPVGCDGSGELWGPGEVRVLLLNPDGTVQAETVIGSGLGGFPAQLSFGDGFGMALAPLGDLDGDGRPELAIGAPLDDTGGVAGTWSQRGTVYVVSLDSTGTVASWTDLAAPLAGQVTDGDGLGWALAASGSGDGRLFVGLPFADDGGPERGALLDVQLAPSGALLSSARLASGVGGAPALADGDTFGAALGSLPATLLAGAEGLAVGAPHADAGGALWLLGLDGPGSVAEAHQVAQGTGGFSGPLDSEDRFASSLAAGGDRDGDGRPELLAGAPGDGGEGALWRLELERAGPGVADCFGSGCPCGNDAPAPMGCANSTGGGSWVDALGSTSLAADDLMLAARGIPSGQFGLFFMGQPAIAPVTFGDGLRCVGATLYRYPVRQANAQGTLVEGPGLAAWGLVGLPAAGHVASGQTWRFQCWYRDPFGGPCGSNFSASSVRAVTFTP